MAGRDYELSNKIVEAKAAKEKEERHTIRRAMNPNRSSDTKEEDDNESLSILTNIDHIHNAEDNVEDNLDDTESQPPGEESPEPWHKQMDDLGESKVDSFLHLLRGNCNSLSSPVPVTEPVDIMVDESDNVGETPDPCTDAPFELFLTRKSKRLLRNGPPRYRSRMGMLARKKLRRNKIKFKSLECAKRDNNEFNNIINVLKEIALSFSDKENNNQKVTETVDTDIQFAFNDSSLPSLDSDEEDRIREEVGMEYNRGSSRPGSAGRSS